MTPELRPLAEFAHSHHGSGAKLVAGALRAVVKADSSETLVALAAALVDLRALSAKPHVMSLGGTQGYRLEDVTEIYLGGVPRAIAEPWIRRRIPGTGKIEVDETGPVVMAAHFAQRIGGAPDRTQYHSEASGRLRVEAFEFHVTEHCNLRCANCCNMSPLVEKRTLSLGEIESMCQEMAQVLIADVFKIMGGEPLLHPEITEVLRIIRQSGLGDRVRLFTNGLLLGKVDDKFWQTLDELTISNYSSAPVREKTLELARRKCAENDVVLNIKPVEEFSQVLSPAFRRDETEVQKTYDRCWLRHRCLIARHGRFYMCTRAAYADDFLARAAHEPQPPGFELDRSGDGIALDTPDLANALRGYMNRQKPLASCRYCFGGDGQFEAHTQLTKLEVRRGILSRTLSQPEWQRDD